MLKEFVVGTSVGRLAVRARDSLELLRSVYASPDDAATLLNDQLALRLVTGLGRAGSTFIDVGAHIGSVMAEVAKADPSIKLVAVEAIPEKCERLRRKFPKAQIHQCAVGDALGEVSFYVDRRQSGYSSLAVRPQGGSADVVQITVPIHRLDELVTASDVDVIKIDVEGAELGVMRGAEALLGRCRPVLMFESGPPHDDGLGFSKPDMWSWLNAHGYSLLVPNRVAHDGPELSGEGFVESHFYPRRTTNYFAVPAERRIEIRDRARHLLGVH